MGDLNGLNGSNGYFLNGFSTTSAKVEINTLFQIKNFWNITFDFQSPSFSVFDCHNYLGDHLANKTYIRPGAAMNLQMNENSILSFYYIYFKLVLEFIQFIQKKEFVFFLDTNIFFHKSGEYQENHPVIRPVIN